MRRDAAQQDVLPGIVVTAFGAFVTYQSRQLPTNSVLLGDALGASAFPYALGILMTVAGVLLVLRGVVRIVRARPATPVMAKGTEAQEASAAEETDGRPAIATARVLAVAAMALAYIVLLPHLGMLLTTPVLLLALILTIAGWHRVWQAAAIAVFVTAIAWALFVAAVGIGIKLWPWST